jgi:hypothetical protein
MRTSAGAPVLKHSLSRFVLLAGAVLCAAPAVSAQEAEQAAEGEHSAHSEELVYRHFVSFFGGLSTYTDAGETGGAMGISYAYKFSHMWSAGLKLEYVTSSIERDIVGLLGVTFEPVDRLEFGVGFGAEQVSVDVIEEEDILAEREWEGLLRLGVAYVFRLREGVSLSPEFNTDISSTRVTLVYGLVFSVGL